MIKLSDFELHTLIDTYQEALNTLQITRDENSYSQEDRLRLDRNVLALQTRINELSRELHAL